MQDAFGSAPLTKNMKAIIRDILELFHSGQSEWLLKGNSSCMKGETRPGARELPFVVVEEESSQPCSTSQNVLQFKQPIQSLVESTEDHRIQRQHQLLSISVSTDWLGAGQWDANKGCKPITRGQPEEPNPNWKCPSHAQNALRDSGTYHTWKAFSSRVARPGWTKLLWKRSARVHFRVIPKKWLWVHAHGEINACGTFFCST